MQFIISVALHVCPLICATKEKQTMMVTVLYQIRKSNVTHFLKTLDSVWKDELEQNIKFTLQYLSWTPGSLQMAQILPSGVHSF